MTQINPSEQGMKTSNIPTFPPDYQDRTFQVFIERLFLIVLRTVWTEISDTSWRSWKERKQIFSLPPLFQPLIINKIMQWAQREKRRGKKNSHLFFSFFPSNLPRKQIDLCIRRSGMCIQVCAAWPVCLSARFVVLVIFGQLFLCHGVWDGRSNRKVERERKRKKESERKTKDTEEEKRRKEGAPYGRYSFYFPNLFFSVVTWIHF